MNYTLTLTSKNQVTIPAELVRLWGVGKGHKLSLTLRGRTAELRSAVDDVNELFGSVKVPKRFKGMEIDEMIEKAKIEYFSRKKI